MMEREKILSAIIGNIAREYCTNLPMPAVIPPEMVALS